MNQPPRIPEPDPGFSITARRDAWPPTPMEWPKPPLEDDVVKEIAKRARYWNRILSRTTPEGAVRIGRDLVQLVLLLVDDHDAYDVVERGGN